MTKKMKAIILYGKGDIRFDEIDLPQIDDDQMLIKVKCAAICGTDIRMYKNGHSKLPIVLGHEVSGEIVKTGRKVKGYSEGMRVAVAPNMGCGICEYCISGQTHLCSSYKAFGINIPGGFAEYMVIPEEAVRQGNVCRISDAVSFEEAALNEPLSCAYNGFTQYGVYPGDNVLIIGAGPIGLMHAKLAKMAGAAKVILNDLSTERLELVSKIEPSFITIAGSDIENEISEITGGKGLNVCVTACPAPSAQTGAFKLMDIGGRINFFGGLPKDKEVVEINTNMIHYKQLQVTGSTRSSVSQFRKTLGFISGGILSVSELVTARYRPEDVQKAFDSACAGEGIKTVITF